MNIKSLMITTIIVYIVMSILGLGFEYFMGDQFASFNALKRDAAGLETHMHWMFLGYFLVTAVFCYLYAQNHEGKGWKEGLRFGLIIGLLFAAMDFTLYSFLPLNFTETLKMMGMDVVIYVAGGITASLVYKSA